MPRCSFQISTMRRARARPMPWTSSSRSGACDQTPGVRRTDSFDEAGAQVFFDSFHCGRLDFLPLIHFELHAVARVEVPKAADLDFFALVQGIDFAHDRNRLAVL